MNILTFIILLCFSAPFVAMAVLLIRYGWNAHKPEPTRPSLKVRVWRAEVEPDGEPCIKCGQAVFLKGYCPSTSIEGAPAYYHRNLMMCAACKDLT